LAAGSVTIIAALPATAKHKTMTSLIDYIITREELKSSPIPTKDKAKMIDKLREQYRTDKAKREREQDEFIERQVKNMRVKYPE